MKSLLDIQQDVLKLEYSVQEISKDIKAINSDIDDLRNSFEMGELDFKTISILSRNIKFDNHPINKKIVPCIRVVLNP